MRKVTDRRAYRRFWNHLSRLRRKGLEIGMDTLLEVYKRRAKPTDILTSRDGSWSLSSLAWVDRNWWESQRRVDGFRLYQSGARWYSKKYKGSWASREQAVDELLSLYPSTCNGVDIDVPI